MRRFRPRAAVPIGFASVALVAGAAGAGWSTQAGALAGKPATSTPKTKTFGGRPCPDPVGHTVTQCRLGVRGIPDLSRRRWAQLYGKEVTISEPVDALIANPDAGGEADWPLIDSLAQPMGRLRYEPARRRFKLTDLAGVVYSVVALNVRGHGCAANDAQTIGFPLVQIIAPKAPSHGTQAFIDGRALDPASVAAKAFVGQLGGGTGCGPAGPERGKVRRLEDPNVGKVAHARLSNGKVNTVTEYDAKAPFGGTVYFMSNTTSVRVGGVARGMVRIGTRVAKVDQFRTCDPNSDGTLKWRYWSIRTGNPARPRIYGWIPARCR